MKKAVFFLMAAVLLLGASPVTQAQSSPSPLSADEADQIFEKFAGSWIINLSEWDPETKKTFKAEGTSKISANGTRSAQEQFQLPQADGSTWKGQGAFQYSESRKRIDFVTKDDSGKTIVLMKSKWYPEQKMLVFLPVVRRNNEFNNQEWRYVFGEDGIITKLTYKKNADGNSSLVSSFKYNRTSVAEL